MAEAETHWLRGVDANLAEILQRLRQLEYRLARLEPPGGPYDGLVEGKREIIDYYCRHFPLQSFADLGGNRGTPPGGYTFYTLETYQVPVGYLVDIEIYDAVRARQTEFPGLTVIEGSFDCPQALDQITYVDAVYVFDVLYIQPRWHELLHVYAPRTRAMLISNVQFTCFPQTVNLIDLGKAEYLKYVPLDEGDDGSWFETLDEFNVELGCTNREAAHCWHWAMTDDDLIAVMKDLGFRLYYMKTLYRCEHCPAAEVRVFLFIRD